MPSRSSLATSWNELWRPVDIGLQAAGFPIEDVDPGPVVRRVEAGDWLGFHLCEEKVSATLDKRGQLREEQVSVADLETAFVGERCPSTMSQTWFRLRGTGCGTAPTSPINP